MELLEGVKMTGATKLLKRGQYAEELQASVRHESSRSGLWRFYRRLTAEAIAEDILTTPERVTSEFYPRVADLAPFVDVEIVQKCLRALANGEPPHTPGIVREAATEVLRFSAQGKQVSSPPIDWFTGVVDAFHGGSVFVTLRDENSGEYLAEFGESLFAAAGLAVGDQFFCTFSGDQDNSRIDLFKRRPRHGSEEIDKMIDGLIDQVIELLVCPESPSHATTESSPIGEPI